MGFESIVEDDTSGNQWYNITNTLRQLQDGEDSELTTYLAIKSDDKDAPRRYAKIIVSYPDAAPAK